METECTPSTDGYRIRYRTGYAEGGNIVCPLLRSKAGVLAHRLRLTNAVDKEGKGVIGPIEIVEASMMPFDPVTGERADIVISPETTNNRINYGRLWEQGLNACRVNVERQLAGMLNVDKSRGAIREQLRRVPRDVMEKAHTMIETFLAMGFSIQLQEYQKMTYEEKVNDVEHILKDKFYLYKPLDNPVTSPVILKQAQELGFLPQPKTLRYWDKKHGEYRDTQYQSIIGSLYYICLEKTGGDWAAVNISSTQPNGIVATNTSREKANSQVRRQATRFPEEASVRSMVASTPTGFAVEIHDRSNNPAATKAIVENIYNAAQPTNIQSIIDRRLFPLGYSSPRVIMRNVMQCDGIAFKYIPFNPDLQARAEIDPITGSLAYLTVEDDPEDKKQRPKKRGQVQEEEEDENVDVDSLDALINSEIEDDEEED